ncbi:MAG: alpha/beta fold hydrolase, partial [Planctomycetes bacterium]|nr:alpha/beta fold hydrolase [Planctomycetota bacterium]
MANAIGLDSGGNIWLAGSVDDGSNPNRPYKPYLLKLRPNALEQLYYTTGLINGNGRGYGLALDRSDHAWVTGTEYIGDDDNAAFIARADGQGSISTRLMTGKAVGYAIAVDSEGDAYVTGRTESASFPTYLDPAVVSASQGTAKLLQATHGGATDAFVAKWTGDLDLVYSTFLGGSASDEGRAIAVDSSGNAYVLGTTYSPDFPTLDSIQKYVNYNRSDCGGTCWITSSDAFLAKINEYGTALLYSTYLGGETPTWVLGSPNYSSEDFGLGLALDRWGRVWATGYTYAGGLPLAGNPLVTFKPGWTVAGWLARLKGDALPVVVVPGAAASVLVDAGGVEYWPDIGGTKHDQLTLYDVPHPTLHPSDILREVWIPGQSASTYGPLLDFLKQKGYREYDHHNQPQYRTSAGCGIQVQQYSSPNLFVFPYDWRLDNAENVARLADYVGCVRQFYPDSKVNLVAHSMGGLLSRRYILDHPNDNYVNALISVGSPYLGAPKMISVEETGDFLPFVADATIKSIAGSFNGVSELLPSQGWYTIGGPSPMADWDTDHDGNGVLTESYSYNQLVNHMDLTHGRGLFFPGYMNRSFHSYATDKGTQDNWSSDKTGVRYYHIYGINSANDTIGQVVATTMWHCLWDEGDCYKREWMLRKFTQGDVTVPALSASRVGPGGNYNAPNATLMACEGSEANDADTEHTAMLSNPVVQNQIVQFLTEADGALPQPLPNPLDCGKGLVQPAAALASTAGANRTSLAGPARMAADTGLAPTFYLLLDGADAITVSDAQGNSDTLAPDGFPVTLPRVLAYPMADHAWQMAMAVSGTYTITFRTIGEPLFLELTEGAQVTATQAIRYRDVALPAGITATLTIAGEVAAPLRYDADGDGVFESVVTPTAALTGDAANDLTPPEVTITGAVETDTIAVTIAAVDSGTGVSRTVYSLDGAHFQAYTGTLHLDPDQVRTVYAFADDNAANRS